MKRKLSGSSEAEARAVYAGLLLISQRQWMVPARRILIQLDNLEVVRKIHAKSNAVVDEGAYWDKFIKALQDYEREYGVIIMGKWQKGHAPKNKEKRNWVNDKCDKLARKGLIEAREWANFGKV